MGTQTIVSREPFLYVKFAWRFLTGNFMDGQRHGDSTWFRRASDNQKRLNAWTRMARMRRAFVRDFILAWALASTITAIVAPDLFWLMTGLAAAYWLARFLRLLDRKLFYKTHGGRITRGNVQGRIDALPDPVAKLFGGKSEL